MRVGTTIFSAVLLSSAVLLTGCNSNDNSDQAPSVAPWDFDLYLVGEFSGWNREEKYKLHFEQGVYKLNNVEFSSGLPPFKVAGPEWDKYPDFSADAQQEISIYPEQKYPMATRGANNRLVVTERGLYDFRVNVVNNNLDAPEISFNFNQDKPTYEATQFLLGLNGSMEPVLALRYLGDNQFAVVARLEAGSHEFVIGDESGKGFTAATAMEIGKSYQSQPWSGGAMSRVEIETGGYYKFILDAENNQERPTIRITRASDDDISMTNPHEGHEVVLKQTYPTWNDGSETVTASVKKKNAAFREFALSTTQELRDPVDGHVTLKEDPAHPVVHTSNLMFDALFALAINDMKLDSVSEISDGSYNGGAPISCHCFKTGAKWNYVWTRDLSYAADLGLATLDPDRVMNSLLFKLSDFRDALKPELNSDIPVFGSGRQIIQDTGTGGSWPISTDRTTWALGAEQALASLSEKNAESFGRAAYEGLRNTIESDRQAAFDVKDGLYSGEQSFLDWREQTYAQWIRQDIAHIGMSKSLSTNATHYVALTLAARLAAQFGDIEQSAKYQLWADNLKLAINKGFWLEDRQIYASLTNTHTDNSPVAKFDMLGIALVTLTGIASEERAAASIANYPHGPFGAPVYFPQQPDVPVYHNRAIWPFVTAYGLKAAAKVHNVAVFDNAMASLMRGAALNLSNMENLEWLSGQPTLLDMNNPDLTGPVINSQRQLWSVGGYLGMVTETLFGYHLNEQGINIKPFITAQAHKFMGSTQGGESVGRSMTLSGLDYQGKKINITIELPEYTEGSQGFYSVDAVSLNGQAVSGVIDASMLADSNAIVVQMGGLQTGREDINLISDVKPLDVRNTRVFAPVEPTVKSVKRSDHGVTVTLEDNKNPKSGVFYNIYRDGVRVAADIDIAQPWLDVSAVSDGGHCYSAEATYADSGNSSHHAKPVCISDGQFFSVDALKHSGQMSAADEHIDAQHIKGWGAPGDVLVLEKLTVTKAGNYDISVQYNNSHHAINLGITNGVKQVKVYRAGEFEPFAEGVIQLPHVLPASTVKPLRDSVPMMVSLEAGKDYRVEIVDFFNMSYLESNATYNDAGGSKPVNTVEVAGIKVIPRS